MNRKKVLSVILIAVLVFTLTACGGGGQTAASTAPAASAAPAAPASSAAPAAPESSAAPAAQATVTLRLAETNAADYPTNLGNLEFARLVGERTNGRIKIEVFPAGQLGDETAVVQELLLGTLDFGRVSAAPVAEFSPGINAIMLPFIYRDGDHMWSVLNGPIGEDLLAAVESAGLVGLTWYDSGARNFYTSKHLKTIDDFKGVKFRMMDSRLMMGIVTSLGGNPVAMGLGEVYGALQTGVIDGAENNIPAYHANGHFEVAPYLLLTGHLRVPELLMGSKTVIDKLSAEDQKIIKEAAYEAQLFQRKAWADREVVALDIIKQDPKVTITEVSPEEWQRFADAVAPLHKEFGAGYEDIMEQIKNTK